MARLSKMGGNAGKAKAQKTKARKETPAKGREAAKTSPTKAKTAESKTANTKRRIVLAAKPRKPPAISDLANELKEAREQQAASAEILKVINASPGDQAPVFDIILEKAHSLCDVTTGSLELHEGDRAYAVAVRGVNRRWEQFLRLGYKIDDSNRKRLQAVHPIQIVDVCQVLERSPDNPVLRAMVEIGGLRGLLALPLIKDGRVFGRIIAARDEVRPFTDHQIALLQSFADQAVIAIENARLFNETKEALEQQKASAEILSVISNSVSDTAPVFEKILDSCQRLFGTDRLAIHLVGDDNMVRVAAWRFAGEVENDVVPLDRSITGQVIRDRRILHKPDLAAEPDLSESVRDRLRRHGNASVVHVPLLWQDRGIGQLLVARTPPKPFSDKELSLLQTFADQAVIAIENARLFNETKEALEQQQASAEILSVISNSVADAKPVFGKILESCKHLFGGDELDVLLVDEQGQLRIAAYIGEFHDVVAATFPAPVERTPAGRAIRERRVMHWPDLVDGEDVPGVLRKMAKLIGYRSMVFAPMLWEDRGIGAIGVARSTGPFKPKELSMLQTFADQAVIAIQNARLFNETLEALEQQKAAAEVLSVISNSVSDTAPVFERILDSCERLFATDQVAICLVHDDAMVHARAVRGSAIRNMMSVLPQPVDQTATGRSFDEQRAIHILDAALPDLPQTIRDAVGRIGNYSCVFAPMLWHQRGIGSICVMRQPPSPFTVKEIALLTTFADQAVIAIQNARLFDEVQERTRELSASLDELRTTQDRLVQTEKLASLGQLTAGIAHEIKNPLNFVNNFSSLSAELVDELDETLAPLSFDQKTRGEIGELTKMLKSNLEKVVQHGERADSIVRNMLLHSREGSAELRAADINALVEESLNLAYHGARAEKPGFNITLKRDLDPEAGAVELYPQEITRALLNLISNGFYAATRRRSDAGDDTFEPALSAATKNLGKTVEIRIRDNGSGIPLEVKEKMFNPFFTTKPAGEGTGLGLSMSHDIIVKQHGGRIDVETEPGVFTEFIITLPRNTTGQEIAEGTN